LLPGQAILDYHIAAGNGADGDLIRETAWAVYVIIESPLNERASTFGEDQMVTAVDKEAFLLQGVKVIAPSTSRDVTRPSWMYSRILSNTQSLKQPELGLSLRRLTVSRQIEW
jgi:hypothetical protein